MEKSSKGTTDVAPVRGWRSLIIQLAISLVISLLFSALPFVFALTLDKSSLPLAIFMSWYSLFPPLVIFLAALWYNSKENSWLRVVGLIWMDVSIWFLLQYVLSALAGSNILILLLSMPAVFAGNTSLFLVGGLIFLIVGIIFYATGRLARRPSPKPTIAWTAISLLVIVTFVIMPTFIAISSNAPVKRPASVDMPTRDQIFGWISDVYNLGERRPGSEADHKAIQYLEAKLHEFGYEDVRVEKSNFDYWEPLNWSLTVQPGTSTAWDAETFYVPYSGPTPAEGVTAEVVDLGNISSPNWQDVKDKIVLVDIPATNVGWDQMKIFSYMAYEPENTLKGISTPYPVGWMLKYIDFYKQVEPRHPAGIIGILRDYPAMGKFTYYAPYDGQLRPIPSLYVSSNTGDKLKALLSSGKTTVKMVLQANVKRMGGESANVYAVLPGQSSNTLIFHSHHDSPWRSGVEDSSGVGMVLALANYYAHVPISERPYTMVFLLTGGHFVGGATDQDFIAKHKGDILAQTLFDICIEHIADDYLPPNQPTGNAQPRGVFLTENPVAISLFATSVASDHISRTVLLPTASPLGVPTDAFPFHQVGVPVISLISGPAWLFDQADTLNRVAKEQLAPIARMYIDFTSRLGATAGILLRFNLTLVVIGLLILIMSPLAALFLVYRRRD